MKHFAILSSLAMTLGSLVTAHTCWAAGEALELQAHLPQGFLFYDAQGYLGVGLRDVDSESVVALRLKDAHGAEVVTVDHDAPAGKSLKVHDVILQLDGQAIANLDQLHRRLYQMPPGRTVTFLISRDGNPINVTVQLCDRTVLQQQAWSQHISVPAPARTTQNEGGEGFLGPAPSGPAAFLGTLIPKALYVGADVNPVRTQLADYFGVKSGTGLLVESVDDQSPASRAGLKAGDVVVKVNSQQMTRRNDWLKAIRNHRGQLVQVTVMRNKQEMTVTMSAGHPKKN
jgi:serine protease Do